MTALQRIEEAEPASTTVKSAISIGSDTPSRTPSVPTSVVTIDASVLAMATLPESDDNEERKTKLCFGSCCDVLRACIVVDIIYLSFVTGAIIMYLADFSLVLFFDPFGNDDDNYDDDDDEEELSHYQTSVYFGASIIQLSVGLFFATIGVTGAARFNKWLVLATAVWFCIDAIFYFAFRNFISGVIIAMYSYPHYALFFALKNGQITRETYSTREKYCCCGDREK